MSTNPARRGPRQVWKGYRNLRVPLELFEDVRAFLNRRKYDYLTSSTDDSDYQPDETTLSMSSEVQAQIPMMLKQIIQEELQKFQETSGFGGPGAIPAYKKTAKEKIKDVLMNNPGTELSTTQLSEMLNMPGPTCRQAARELAQADPDIKQFHGRPSKYQYNS